jgi:hypothetical protein
MKTKSTDENRNVQKPSKLAHGKKMIELESLMKYHPVTFHDNSVVKSVQGDILGKRKKIQNDRNKLN